MSPETELVPLSHQMINLWHPSGMQAHDGFQTGGVAALNHRLMSVIPPGWGKRAPFRWNFPIHRGTIAR